MRHKLVPCVSPPTWSGSDGGNDFRAFITYRKKRIYIKGIQNMWLILDYGDDVPYPAHSPNKH